MAFQSQNERLRQMLLQAFGYPELVDLFIEEVTEVVTSELADGSVTAPKLGDPTPITALLDDMVGDAGSGGTKGLAPAPAAGDAASLKFLRADGTWEVPMGDSITVGAGVTDGTANYILFEGAGNLLAEDAKLQFDGTNMSVNAGLTLGAIGVTNYELDVRGGAGNSTIQLSNTASGDTSADGLLLDFTGSDFIINNQEAGGVNILPGPNGILVDSNYFTLGRTDGDGVTEMYLAPGVGLDNYDTSIVLYTQNVLSGGFKIRLRGGFSAGDPAQDLKVQLMQTENASMETLTNGILRESRESLADVNTTDNTTTTLYSKTIGVGEHYLFEAKVIATRSGSPGDAAYIRRALITDNGLVGSVQDDFTAESNANLNATWDYSGGAARLRITGDTGQTWDWRADVTYQAI